MQVYVIGAANIDITGQALNQLRLKDSNPGQISIAFGGVARNIVENLAKLGVKTTFISVFSNDLFGLSMLKHLETLGVNIKPSLIVKGDSTSTYLAILNKEQDMEIAISDTAILKHLTPKYLAPILKKIKKDDLVVIDTNLSEKALAYIFKNCVGRIFVDPVSTTKALKIKQYLKYIYALKPNIYEAQELTGLKLNNKKDIERAAKKLQGLGISKVFISLGKMGAFATHKNESYLANTGNVSIKSSTGAGDAFMAGIVKSEIENRNIMQTLKYANGCSLIALQSLKTVSDKISDQAVLKIIKRK